MKKVLESYAFTFTYPNEENPQGSISIQKESVKKKIKPMKDIRGSTINLMRTMITINEALKPLPTNRMLSMRLHYNKSAPSDYQPEHFRPLKQDEYVEGNKKRKVGAGKVDTGLHCTKLKLQIGADRWKEESSDEESESSDEESDSGELTQAKAQKLISEIQQFVRENNPTVKECHKKFPMFTKEKISAFMNSIQSKENAKRKASQELKRKSKRSKRGRK